MFKDDIKIIAENEIEAENVIKAIRIYCQDIEVKFGNEKCAKLLMKSEKKGTTEGIELPN